MKPHLIWMPIYPGDYLKDTQFLSRKQHGSYLITMLAYWVNNGPLTHKKFMALAGQDADALMDFFNLTEDGMIHHKRIDKELANAFKRWTATNEKFKKLRQFRKLPQRKIDQNPLTQVTQNQ